MVAIEGLPETIETRFSQTCNKINWIRSFSINKRVTMVCVSNLWFYFNIKLILNDQEGPHTNLESIWYRSVRLSLLLLLLFRTLFQAQNKTLAQIVIQGTNLVHQEFTFTFGFSSTLCYIHIFMHVYLFRYISFPRIHSRKEPQDFNFLRVRT